MSEPKWSDVEVGDAIIAETIVPGDATVSGTVVDPGQAKPGARWGYYLSGMSEPLSSNHWTLLDIVKPEPEPQLPTASGSVITCNGDVLALDYRGWFSHYRCHSTAILAEVPWELVYDAGKK